MNVIIFAYCLFYNFKNCAVTPTATGIIKIIYTSFIKIYLNKIKFY